MGELDLWEENITINLNVLQTLLVSEVVSVFDELLKFLIKYNLIEAKKINTDTYEELPDYEQTASVLLKSSEKGLSEVRQKIYDSGSAIFGEEIPLEFAEIMSLYDTIVESIFQQFVKSIQP